MYLKTRTVKCPECGAVLHIASTSGITNCQYCHTPILYRLENEPSSFYIRSQIGLKDASRILLKNLRHFLIARDFIQKSRIVSRTLYYVPFLCITGYRCGQHIIKEQDRTTYEVKEDTRVLFSSFRHFRPAVSLTNWGISGTNPDSIIKNGIIPVQLREDITQEDAVYLRPDITINSEEELLRDFATMNKDISTEIIIENRTILYYPIIRVILQYRNNIFHFSIDGVTGEIIYGIAPEAEDNRFIPMALSSIVIAWICGGLFNFIIKGIASGGILGGFFFLPVFLIFILSILFAIYVAWIFYRNYGEIVIRGDKVEINKLNIPETTPIEKLLSPLFKILEQMVLNSRKKYY